MEIFYHTKFKKQFKKLDKNLKKLTLEKEDLFKVNPFDLSLKTHKLHGKFLEYLAFWINYKYRVIFSYTENEKDVRFHEIGTHDIYE